MQITLVFYQCYRALPPAATDLVCDIYEPTGDSIVNRPVIIVAHTGSFLPAVVNGQPTGTKTDSSIVEQCMRWAKKGYVAVAFSNRLGWNPTSTDQGCKNFFSYTSCIQRNTRCKSYGKVYEND